VPPQKALLLAHVIGHIEPVAVELGLAFSVTSV